MSEWEEVSLNDLCTVTSSKRIFRHEYVSSGIPFYRSKEIIEKALSETITECLFISEERFREIQDKFGSPKPGDILISSVGARSGIPYLIKEADGEFYFKDGNLIWIKNFSDKLNSHFLLYWLNSHIGQDSLESIMIGSAQPALTIVGMSNLDLIIPKPSEQKEIASVLSCLDRKIENLRKQNETLEAIAQTLFKHWFVDFEFPNADGKPYKSSGGAMEPSELGDIPAGWRVGKLGDVSDIGSSKRIFRSEYVELGIPFYRSKEIIELSSGQEVSTQLYISTERFKDIREKFGAPEAGEILVTSVGTIGITYLVTKEDKFYFKDGNLTWIKNFKNGFNGVIINYWIKSDSAKNQIDQNTIGSTQKALTIQALSSLKLIISSPELLENYREFVDSIHSKTERNTQQIRILTKTRDVLLPKLMSGKLRIKD